MMPTCLLNYTSNHIAITAEDAAESWSRGTWDDQRCAVRSLADPLHGRSVEALQLVGMACILAA